MFKASKGDHRTVKEYIKEITYEKYKMYNSFSFVRNPWDKMVSHYFFNKNYFTNENTKKLVRDWPRWKTDIYDFDDWIKLLPEIKVPYSYPSILYTNQVQMLKNDKEEIDVDFIGKIENYKSDWKFITKKLGIKEEKKLIHSDYNTTQRKKNYRIYYKKEETIEIVRNRHKEDIEYFNYKF